MSYLSSAPLAFDGGLLPHDPRQRRSVFVGDLSFFCTEIDLANVFSRFGHVVTVEIKRGRHGDSLLHGFVEFDCDSAAELAIQHMNGRRWMGRKLRVNRTNISHAVNPEQDSWIQVHVNFTCKDLSRKIDEELLQSIFIPFGGLVDVTVKRHGCTGHPLQTTGYGFAYFKESFCALRAVHALRVIVIDGVRFECSLSRKAEATISQTMGNNTKLSISSMSKLPSPTSVTDYRKQAQLPTQFNGTIFPGINQSEFTGSIPQFIHNGASPSFSQPQENQLHFLRELGNRNPNYANNCFDSRTQMLKETLPYNIADAERSVMNAFSYSTPSIEIGAESTTYNSRLDRSHQGYPLVATQTNSYSLF